jgi:hypothetical protein
MALLIIARHAVPKQSREKRAAWIASALRASQ